jgi:type II secretory pathway pseudopilin PulG
MRHRVRRVLRFWPILVVMAGLLVAYALWPARYKFTVSQETTYVTESVDAHGFLDYQGALNDRLGQGISPDTNANVLIWQALGPHPEGGTMPPEYFRRLGIPSPPEKGDYFIAYDKYFQDRLKARPGNQPEPVGGEQAQREQWSKRVDRAQKWPWKSSDEPEIVAWLQANEKPLTLMIEVGSRPHYYNPLVSRSDDPTSARLMGSFLPSVQSSRACANALIVRAMGRLGDGQPDLAWRELMATQRLGRLVARGGTLIETLVGVAIVSIASNAQVTFLGQGNHPSKRVLAWLADLRSLPPMPSLADKIGLSERFMTLDVLMSVAIHGPHVVDQLADVPNGKQIRNEALSRMLGRSINFDPAFRNANRMFDQCEAACRLPDRETRKKAFGEIADEIKQRKSAVAEVGLVERNTMSSTQRGEYFGDILLALLLPALDKMQDANDRIEQTVANLQIAFALAAYRTDAGRYPSRLEDLAPKYLPQIPNDLFSCKPLLYRISDAGYLFYSVGVNGIDEEGRWLDDDPKGDDLRVRMPVAEPTYK